MQLDFASSDAQAGFRLDRVEVFNWGTFDQNVWTLHAGGQNTLLTGEIGSGKSTWVDAITTLLVPAQRITYNKAAGAETRERTLRSYVLGYYKSERKSGGGVAKPVALRDHNSYSAVLASFVNVGFSSRVTIAQLFHFADLSGQPKRLYLCFAGDLSIRSHLADFGDIKGLRKRLRGIGVDVRDTFPPYGGAFRRALGIKSEQALELFNQTVSMKSVGNLTDFVRAHMLEPGDAESRVDGLIAHFEALNLAHEAVVRARKQIAVLEPLIADADSHAEACAGHVHLEAQRDALTAYFAKLQGDLLEARIALQQGKITELTQQIASTAETLIRLTGERDRVRDAIHEAGGDRIEQLQRMIDEASRRRDERRQRCEAYDATATALGLEKASDASAFARNHAAISSARQECTQLKTSIQEHITRAAVELEEKKRGEAEVASELGSLRGRTSNIPARQLAIRARLADAIGAEEDELPFVGELLQVREDEREWEGAAERVLHGFALSMLVSDGHYKAVASWVDKTHLRGRLVYYRAGGRPPPPGAPPAGAEADALSRKLMIKPDSGFYEWLEITMVQRFDHICCADLRRFRREKKALTRAGQIKGAQRHEKDDTYRIDDRSRYVLGWQNTEKIATLERMQANLQAECQAAAERHGRAKAELAAADVRGGRLERLSVYSDFVSVDWRSVAAQIDELAEEQRMLEEASDVLVALRDKLRGVDEELASAGKAQREKEADRARYEDRNLSDARALGDCRELAAGLDEALLSVLEDRRAEALTGLRLTIESCDKAQQQLRKWLQSEIDGASARIRRLEAKIIDQMHKYREAWRLDTQDVDMSLESIDEFREMLLRRVADDLPRFERDFKRLLNENTIREVASFQAHLHKERQLIRERIATINESLHQIDYNKGRYIQLVDETALDREVRDFQQELKACTSGTFDAAGDDAYTEAKFLQVKAVVERLEGREGQTELDRRWTKKVTDVRNWFDFAAVERWREDDSEHEHYSDSSGKSGGQKEKLAYTVLAASLAYQFGLQWGEKRSRSFRFVVIDEAFARGSDESATYGLELFKRLNLQLLIVTPLQKIYVIEPYVASVGFVHSDEQRSMLRTLTIEEYREEKKARGTAR